MNSLPLPNARQTNLIVALSCAGLMAIALYMEHFMALEPCHLCIMQRVMVIGAGIITFAAALHGPAALGTDARPGRCRVKRNDVFSPPRMVTICLRV